jgi:glucose/arabinose dehydrogenase
MRKLNVMLIAGAMIAAALLVAGYQLQQAVRAEPAPQAAQGEVLRGRAAFGDVSTDRPGVRRMITTADLVAPYATEAARNFPRVVPRPQNVWPQAPAGFSVQLYASGLEVPRKIITAPNGDIFVTESTPGRIRVLRGVQANGSHAQMEIFATGLNRPFGLAFYPNGANPQYLYVGNTNSVVRIPYRNGDLKARGEPEMIVSGLPTGGHWTRDVVFTRDGSKMLVAVGSASNVSDDAAEERRARVLEFTPDGKNERPYATGIRNPVGLSIHPQTGDLWTSVNERDGLGDDLVPDYITRVQPGGFYGWPWYYLGPNQDPRHQGKQPDLRERAIVPDVLLQAHTASLAMTFYTGTQFPAQYRGHAYASQHGSWNRARRTGYKVIYAPVVNGRATGEYVDFLIGFANAEGEVWGRPVGVTVASDGALLVTDDGSHSIWRVSYTGGSQGAGRGD